MPKEGLSPETHYIDVIARSDDDKSVARTQISFTVPGQAQPKLEISSEEFSLDRAEKILSFELSNTGNVIMRPKPTIIISQNGQEAKSIEYKTPIQIMPTRTYPLSMRLDTSSLEVGLYEVQVVFSDRDNIEIVSTTERFEVKDSYQTPLTEQNYLIPIIISVAFILLVSTLLVVNKQLKKRQDPVSIQLRRLEQREKATEKELQKLINNTHHIVNQTNKWIKKNMGEEYELR